MAPGSSGRKREKSPDVDTVEEESLLQRLAKRRKQEDGVERGRKKWRVKAPQPDEDSKEKGFV